MLSSASDSNVAVNVVVPVADADIYDCASVTRMMVTCFVQPGNDVLVEIRDVRAGD